MGSDRTMADGDETGPFQMKIKNQNPFGSFAMPDQSKVTLTDQVYPSMQKINASSGVNDEIFTLNQGSLPKIKTVLITPRRSHAIMEKYNRFRTVNKIPFASTKGRKASHQNFGHNYNRPLGGTLKLN